MGEVKYLPLLLNKQVMTQEQMEHALKVMYEEIKQLKIEVKGLETTLDMFYTIDLDGTTKKRDYWNTDNHKNR